MEEFKNNYLIKKSDNYYALNLNKETGSYVYKIIAMKELVCNPKVYGLSIRKKDLRIVYATKKILVDSTIHDLSGFSKKIGIDIKTLRVFNPWLKTERLPNPENKKYIIEIPVNKTFSRAIEIESGVLDSTVKEMSTIENSAKKL